MTALSEQSVLSSATRGSAAIRPDIQGLRAVAVIAVLLDHLIGWPLGGYAGVDVFFVISGFLITDQLLRAYETDGRISLARFYGRRVRRILPAALAVLAVTAVAAHFAFNSVRATATLVDSLWAAVFLANVHFAAVGTDYFHASTAASPVQHYWSLSVEEQFYLVWPAIVILLLSLAVAARRERARPTIAVLALIIVVASFAWSLTETAHAPAVAYFDTLGRAWELGVGALLAGLVPVLTRMPRAFRVLFGWSGLAGILIAILYMRDTVAFPGPWAALPVVSTALVIAGGVGGVDRTMLPIANPVTSYIGRVSYSLYLWHVPVIAFMLVLAPTQTALTTALVLGLIVAVSLVGYYLVEQPFHETPSGGGTAEEKRMAWQHWRSRFGAKFMGSAIGIAVIALVVVLVTGSSLPTQNPLAAPETAADATGALQADLASALTATSWPTDLSPTLDDVIATTTLDNPAKQCFDPGPTPSFDQCTWGLASAPHSMYLVGDSTALAYAPAFKAIAEASGGQWRITTIGLFGCRFTDVLVQGVGDGVMDSCPTRKADIAARIAADAPDLVVMSNAFTDGITADGTPLTPAALVTGSVNEAALYGVPVVYLSPPPLGADLGQCYSPLTSPQACTVGIDDTWNAFAGTLQSTVGADRFISSLPFSCVDGRCPAFAGTTPTKFDEVHLTTAFSVRVAPAIRSALDATGLMQ